MSLSRGNGVWILIALACLAGCEYGSAAPGGGTSGAAAALDPETILIRDLAAAGRLYHNCIDARRKGPSGWDDFRQSADGDAEGLAALDRLQAAGYQFTWNVELNGNVSMIETVLAQSSSKPARLMLDGSIGGVSPEAIEKARQAGRPAKSKSSQSRSSQAAAAKPEKMEIPLPAEPSEKAIYDYLTLCDQYLVALGRIKDLSSAQNSVAAMRNLNARFDLIGATLAKQGMQADFLATPARYKDAIREVDRRNIDESNRIAALPDGEAINELMLREVGLIGPVRALEAIQEEFTKQMAARRSNSAGEASGDPGVPPGHPNSRPGRPNFPPGHPGLPPGFPQPEDLARASGAAPGFGRAAHQPPASERSAPELRTWSDRSGQFQVQAALVSKDEQKVKLRKDDGRLIAVPLERLSDADQEYLAKASGAFSKGDKVEVFWGSRWYPASVVEADGDRFHIAYDGYSESWNEWVGPDRIRARP